MVSIVNVRSCRTIAGRLFVAAVLFNTVLAWGAAYPAMELDCSRASGSLPQTAVPAGTANSAIPVEHIVIIMEENHSFDNFFGRLSQYSYGNELDGLTDKMWNPDGNGNQTFSYHETAYCVKNTEHGWDSSHRQWNNGANDGFVTENGGGKSGMRAMGSYDETDLGFLYEMADRFTVGDRFFSSLLGPTFPNRSYFYGGSSWGHLRNNYRIPQDIPLIFDVLNKYDVSWKYYYHDIAIAMLMRTFSHEDLKHFAHISQYRKDLEEGTLPSVSYIESSFIFGEEHPPFNFQIGQRQVAQHIESLLNSKMWATSALFLAFDEHGGYFDHVAPPEACKPDEIEPKLGGKDKVAAHFDRLGFRVPFMVLSPFAKRHYVSHVTYDHTSILKFIETKFNLPALTRRDANADAMLDLFDFDKPQYDYPTPALPTPDWAKCLPFRKGR